MADRREMVPLPKNPSGHDRNRIPMVREGLSVLDPRNRTHEEITEQFENKRAKYAAMHAHREMAAMVLAAGGTFKLAAAKAGVSVRQVKKYYVNPDFRQRIEELRQTALSKIRGRVVKELERRTEPAMLKKEELLNVLRIYDRVYGPPGSKNPAGVQIAGDVNVNNYDAIIQALLTPESGEQGQDFPIYEPESIRPPSPGTEVEG